MKRIIFAFALLFMLPTITASAQSYLFRTDINYDFDKSAIVLYDDSNKIASVINTSFTVTDNGLLCKDIDIPDNNLTAKLFLPDGITILKGEIYKEDVAEETIKEYNKNVYKENSIALFAPAMVSKVKSIYHDDEDKFEVTLLYQGFEQSFIFGQDMEISTASDAYQSAIGNNVGYLKPGDAIILNHAFVNDPRSITLLYRPTNNEHVFDSTLTDFLPLYTYSQGTKNKVAIYSFGVITEATDNYLILTEKDGTARNSNVITIHPDASLYTFNVTEGSAPETDYTAGIYPSYIAEEDIDQNGNIITWQPQESRIYALVRLVDDIATDILVYEY